MIQNIAMLITTKTVSIWAGWYIALSLYLYYRNNLTIRNAINSSMYYALHGIVFSFIIYVLNTDGGLAVDPAMYVVAGAVSLLFILSLATAWVAHLVSALGKNPKPRIAKLCRELGERFDPTWLDQIP